MAVTKVGVGQQREGVLRGGHTVLSVAQTPHCDELLGYQTPIDAVDEMKAERLFEHSSSPSPLPTRAAPVSA